MLSYAAQTGLASPAVRPKSGIQTRKDPEENKKKPQKLLLTWMVEEPKVYSKIKKYISPEDFTEDLYKKVAEKLFADFEAGTVHPAAIVSLFTDEEEQREVAEVFNTKLPRLETKSEQEKAFHDIVLAVKRSSLEYLSSRLGSDISALNQVIEGKKALEELSKTHISLD